jgi:hypothetical protein
MGTANCLKLTEIRTLRLSGDIKMLQQQRAGQIGPQGPVPMQAPRALSAAHAYPRRPAGRPWRAGVRAAGGPTVRSGGPRASRARPPLCRRRGRPSVVLCCPCHRAAAAAATALQGVQGRPQPPTCAPPPPRPAPPTPAAGGQVSERVLATDPPVVVKTKQLMAGREGVLSLAQGVVHWWGPQWGTRGRGAGGQRRPAVRAGAVHAPRTRACRTAAKQMGKGGRSLSGGGRTQGIACAPTRRQAIAHGRPL